MLTLSLEQKQKIVKAIFANRHNFTGSDAKYAESLGINKGILSRLKQGYTNKVVADDKLIHIARRLNVAFSNESEWKTANTSIYAYITGQLTISQQEGASGIYCDRADLGKTHTAKEYIRTHKNAVYIDCSRVKNKQKLIRAIAKEFGVDNKGKYADVFDDLVWYLKTIDKPLVILDEAGDLDYAAFLELKALWNATENYCGWYMMGADGLQSKIDRAMNNKKVGYTEIFSRYGGKYQALIIGKLSTQEAEVFKTNQVALLIQINLPNHADIQKLVAKCNGSLRRARLEITKLKRAA